MTRVVLLRGTGPKAQFNGMAASVGTPRRGWATATVAGRQVKWRSGHWTEDSGDGDPSSEEVWGWCPTMDTTLEVMKHLATPGVCALLQTCKSAAALRAYPCFSECRLQSGLPAGYGVHLSKGFAFARHLGVTRCELRELHLEISRSELDVLRWLLQEANTAALTTATLSYPRWSELGPMSLGAQSHAVVIDVDSFDYSSQTAEHDAIIAGFSSQLPAGAALSLTGTLEAHCPALTALTLIREVDDVPALSRIKSLVRLEAHFLEADDVNFVLAELPRLTHLTITGGNVISLYGEALDIVSTSLQVLDISRSTKGLGIASVDCPTLREIRCRDPGNYGNGLVVVWRDEEDVLRYLGSDYELYQWNTGGWGPEQAHADWLKTCLPDQPCAFVGHNVDMGSGKEAAGPLVSLPDLCTVLYEGWGDKRDAPLRASVTMSLRAFEEQMRKLS